MNKYIYCLSLFSILFSSCGSSSRIHRTVGDYFKKDTLFSSHFTGFALYDPSQKKMLFEHDANHFFTPASNTKILTLFSALKTLPDTLASVKYAVRNDSLYLWGQGDPTTLNPAFGRQDHLLEFLAKQTMPVVICSDLYRGHRFGSGWAWDDYPYAYQTEKSALPLFGNLLHLEYQEENTELILYPNNLLVTFNLGNRLDYHRGEMDNRFTIHWPQSQKNGTLNIPLHMSDTILAKVFSEYTDYPLTMTDQCPTVPQKKTLGSVSADTVYAYMMQHSDNFIAEQLLLAVAAQLTDTLETEIAIREIKKRYLSDLAPQLQWYDGSGLSRYNLFTPLAITRVLAEIYSMLTIDQLKKIFAAGGQSGTIINWYKNENGTPFVYAKTGSLMNVHCLSGYLLTDSGKLLIFSFMHNHFTGGSNIVKTSMDEVLRFIKKHY